jgi:hypothetical protein
VLALQTVEKDSYEWDLLFSQIYAGIAKTIEITVTSYRQALKGDLHHGFSEAQLLLLKSVKTFVFQGYEFSAYYVRALRNRLIDLKRSAAADKNKPHFDLSLDYMALNRPNGREYHLHDYLALKPLHCTDSYHNDELPNLDGLIEEYGTDHPQAVGVIDLLITYAAEGFSKSELTAALAAYYGSAEYDGKIQRRVSRIRQSFKEFLLDRGLSLSF